MAIQPTDLFLANKDGKSYKVEASNLTSKDGLLLVNRDGKSYKCVIAQVPNKVRNTDILLVNRGGVSYKVLGGDVKLLFGPPEGRLITGITWSQGTYTTMYPGSSPVSESVIYDDNPSTGFAMQGQNSSPAQGPLLFADFSSLPDKWHVTHVVYGPWNSDIADDDWTPWDTEYSINRVNVRSNLPNFIQYPEPKKQSETQTIQIAEYNNTTNMGLGVTNMEFERRESSLTPVSWYLAIAQLKVYGYKVDASGNPIPWTD